jgi:hypothetical protein
MAYIKSVTILKQLETYLDALAEADGNLIFRSSNPQEFAKRLRNAVKLAEDEGHARYKHIKSKYMFKPGSDYVLAKRRIYATEVITTKVDHPELVQENLSLLNTPIYKDFNAENALQVIQAIIMNDDTNYFRFPLLADASQNAKLLMWAENNAEQFKLEFSATNIRVDRL